MILFNQFTSDSCSATNVYLPFTRLYLLAKSDAWTPFPEPVGPNNTILGVCGALERDCPLKNV